MCIVVVVGGHGRVATAHQRLLRGVEDLTYGDANQIVALPTSVGSATICSAGHGYGPIALEVC